jgi:hypothetical protein
VGVQGASEDSKKLQETSRDFIRFHGTFRDFKDFINFRGGGSDGEGRVSSLIFDNGFLRFQENV